jgi:hypothetical protein
MTTAPGPGSKDASDPRFAGASDSSAAADNTMFEKTERTTPMPTEPYHPSPRPLMPLPLPGIAREYLSCTKPPLETPTRPPRTQLAYTLFLLVLGSSASFILFCYLLLTNLAD